jgi:hypothetical protein
MGNYLVSSIFLFIGSILGVIVFHKPNYFVEPIDKKEPKRSIHEEYLKTRLDAFLLLFSASQESMNSNIHAQGEEQWERRKMLEHTPVGNVFMWYDMYKQAFCYCSDTQIQYSILNACAMKYTRLYFCRDFFVDTNILPDSFENPFNKQKDDEDKKERDTKKEKKRKLGIDFDPTAFVSTKQSKIDERTKTIYKNNFRYMGKLSSQSFLQKSVLKPNEKKNDVITQSFCYKDWKSKLRDFTCI